MTSGRRSKQTRVVLVEKTQFIVIEVPVAQQPLPSQERIIACQMGGCEFMVLLAEPLQLIADRLQGLQEVLAAMKAPKGHDQNTSQTFETKGSNLRSKVASPHQGATSGSISPIWTKTTVAHVAKVAPPSSLKELLARSSKK